MFNACLTYSHLCFLIVHFCVQLSGSSYSDFVLLFYFAFWQCHSLLGPFLLLDLPSKWIYLQFLCLYLNLIFSMCITCFLICSDQFLCTTWTALFSSFSFLFLCRSPSYALHVCVMRSLFLFLPLHWYLHFLLLSVRFPLASSPRFALNERTKCRLVSASSFSFFFYS